jgi:hypothetical protein
MNSRGLRLTLAFFFNRRDRRARRIIFLLAILALLIEAMPAFAEYQQIDLTVYGMD